jgi:hypothetical protein
VSEEVSFQLIVAIVAQGRASRIMAAASMLGPRYLQMRARVVPVQLPSPSCKSLLHRTADACTTANGCTGLCSQGTPAS